MIKKFKLFSYTSLLASKTLVITKTILAMRGHFSFNQFRHFEPNGIIELGQAKNSFQESGNRIG